MSSSKKTGKYKVRPYILCTASALAVMQPAVTFPIEQKRRIPALLLYRKNWMAQYSHRTPR